MHREGNQDPQLPGVHRGGDRTHTHWACTVGATKTHSHQLCTEGAARKHPTHPLDFTRRNWGPEKAVSGRGHQAHSLLHRPFQTRLFLGSSKGISARTWYTARSLGFSQELVFVQRDEKGEAVIKGKYLGSEFTAGSQELDTISQACTADVKGNWELCLSHMGAPKPPPHHTAQCS